MNTMHLPLPLMNVIFCRNHDKTGYDKFENIASYSFQMRLPGRPAGRVISFYEDTLKIKLDRVGVQLAFAFYFFDDGCWNCAHPFHHRPDCVRDLNPTLHDIAKRMHEINHPPSPGRMMEKFERKLRYQNRGRPSSNS